MICPECKASGLKSEVYPGGSTTTLMYCPPFFDEDGKRHDHDLNTLITSYVCTNGHNWAKNSSGICWCGWCKRRD